MERAEGGESHCNHTWGDVLTDGLRFRIRALGSLLSSHTAREIPQSSSAAFLQEFSCPHKGPPDIKLLPLNNRENIILPLWNAVIQLPDQSLWSCTCSLDSLCLSPAAQSPWIGKARAAGAQSVCTVFVYSRPSKDAETDQVFTQTHLSWSDPGWASKPLSLIWYHRWASPDLKYLSSLDLIWILKFCSKYLPFFLVLSEEPWHENQMWYLLSWHPFTYTQTIKVQECVINYLICMQIPEPERSFRHPLPQADV